MRVNLIAATFLASLSCALLTVSCVQSKTPTETDGTAQFRVPDDGCAPPEDVAPTSATSLDEQATETSEFLESESTFRYSLCVLLKCATPQVRAAFCVSQPESDVRARCYAHRYDNAVGWANWCYAEFGE
jgi:hypothetical protein